MRNNKITISDFEIVDINELCQHLNWDSHFFGFRVARVKKNKITKDDMKILIEWCCFNRIKCLYFLCDIDDEQTFQLVDQHDFHLVDIRITCNISNFAPPIIHQDESNLIVSSNSLPHVKELRGIARESHTGTRFYFDRNFPRYLCDDLYETWIDKSCHGYADMVLVAILGDQPVGYLTCHLVDEKVGNIGLFGVKKEFRGKSIGSELINQGKQWFYSQGISCINVVTQGRNSPALRFYQRNGFSVEKLQIWYHRWF